jgi:hypothetical protein
MSNPLLLRNFTAGAAILPYRIVKISASETVITTASATDMSMGVCDYVSPAVGERVDIVLIGVAYVEAGAVIAAGALVTSDAVGRCVTAAPAAGANVRLVGIALEAATAVGDVIRVLIEFGSMQG